MSLHMSKCHIDGNHFQSRICLCRNRVENACNAHKISNTNFEKPIKAQFRYALNCSATKLPVNKSIIQGKQRSSTYNSR